MPVVQQLRTTDATKVPAALEAGQIAFNLANRWMFVGNGGDDILVNGAPLAAYGSAQTVLGVNSVAVPAKPVGKGYEVYLLAESETEFLSIADNLVNTAGGVGLTAKANAALVTAGSIAGAAALGIGDILTITAGTGGPFAGAPQGAYIWDGTGWVSLGAIPPGATTTAAGLVMLARDTDVAETGAPGETTPDPLAVATAVQLKAAVDRFAGMVTGQTLLGVYDATAGAITSVSPAASTAPRAGFAAAGKLGAGTGAMPGDYMRIGTAGTVAGETGVAAALNGKVFSVGDYVVFDGAEWHSLAVPPPPTPTLHGLGDVSDTTVATVTAANAKGLLIRDGSVADGAPNAYKLIDVLDLGQFMWIGGLATVVWHVLQGAQLV